MSQSSTRTKSKIFNCSNNKINRILIYTECSTIINMAQYATQLVATGTMNNQNKPVNTLEDSFALTKLPTTINIDFKKV